MEEEITEQIAKNGSRQVAEGNSSDTGSTDTLDAERPEMPEDMSENGMMGGPMGGFPGQANTVTTTETNEWLVPMTATGIISGAVILSAVAVCLTIWFTRKKA